MKDENKTKEQLIEELMELRHSMAELKKSEIESQQVKKELKDSKQGLQTILNNLPAVIYLKDLQGRHMLSNSLLEKLLNKTKEEIIGKTDYELVPKKVADSVRINDMQVINSRKAISFEEKIQLPGGEHVYLTDKFPLIDDSGAVSAVGGVAMDITDRIKLEEALRKSEENFRSTFENAAIGVAVANPEGCFQKVNKVFCEIFGYSEQELLTKEFWDLCHPDELETCREQIKRLINKETNTFQLEKRYFHKTGKIILGQVNVSVVRDSKGNMLHTIAQIQDITERKAANEKLKKSEWSLKKSQEVAHLGSWEWDLTTNEEVWSDETYRLLDVDRDIVKGLHKIFENRLHPDDKEITFKTIEKTISTGGKYSVNFRIILPDSTERVLHSEGELICDDSGKSRKLIGTTQDITRLTRMKEEHIKMEKELQNRQKLESLGVLAGGIAHDFNNILTSIMGNISIAKVDLNTKSETYERLTKAETASMRAKDLAHQLRTFSKGGVLVKEVASITELIKETAIFALYGSSTKPKFFIPEDIWFAEIDQGQISQVIHNLIINADEAMTEARNIKINVNNIVITKENMLALKEGRYIKISITDQGEGIPAEHLSKIFDPYFTTKEKGSGLGLTISYSIIAKHKGIITVDSTLGIGTTFDIYLPASLEMNIKKKNVASTPLIGNGKILLMDDEKEIRDVASKMLKKIGYEVECTKDGTEAIKTYEKAMESGEPFDAVILDSIVPGGMGGKETIKKLLEINPYVKVIMSSGYSAGTVISDFTKFGFISCLPKPYVIHEMARVMYKTLKG